MEKTEVVLPAQHPSGNRTPFLPVGVLSPLSALGLGVKLTPFLEVPSDHVSWPGQVIPGEGSFLVFLGKVQRLTDWPIHPVITVLIEC